MDGLLNPERLHELLAADAAGLLAAARSADPAAPIAACPEWTITDLVWHIGVVHRFWATIVGERRAEPPEPWPPERPADDEQVFAFAEESTARVLAALRGAASDEPVWTWCPGAEHVGFVRRRMAVETAVHRVDAERAAGRDHRVDADLAADGIDEYLTRLYPLTIEDGDAPTDGSVHLHCTDTEGEWSIVPDDAGVPVVTREHRKATTALRGPAHDLLMALWRRGDLAGVEVFGDEDLAGRFLAATDLS